MIKFAHTGKFYFMILHSTNSVKFFLILTFNALRFGLRCVKKIKTLIICHPIFNERSIGSTVI